MGATEMNAAETKGTVFITGASSGIARRGHGPILVAREKTIAD